MITPTPEAIEAAARALHADIRSSEDWDDAPSIIIDEFHTYVRIALTAAAPFIAAQAKGEVLSAVIGQMELSERRFAESKDYPETPEFIRGFREGRYKVQHIRNELDFNAKARARRVAAIEGKSE